MRVEEYLDLYELLEEEFLDVMDIAFNTPRAGLSPVIKDLQDVRRKIRDIEVQEENIDLFRTHLACVDRMD